MQGHDQACRTRQATEAHLYCAFVKKIRAFVVSKFGGPRTLVTLYDPPDLFYIDIVSCIDGDSDQAS